MKKLKINKLSHHSSLINSAQLLVDNTNVEQYVPDLEVILLIRDKDVNPVNLSSCNHDIPSH